MFSNFFKFHRHGFLLLASLLVLWTVAPSQGQGSGYKPYSANAENQIPVSPTAFQFTKYTDLPVSEYTGIPSIRVPLYNIKVDGCQLPLELSYHASGIRINQEASWVGLGWDLQLGSIVQTINDVDDFALFSPITAGLATKKILPDYSNSGPLTGGYPYREIGFPYSVPRKYNPYGFGRVLPVAPLHGFMVATDYYAPVDRDIDTPRINLFDGNEVDSEPDVFKANFLGHSLAFVLDFYTNEMVPLNKAGYKVTKILAANNTLTGWRIKVPAGEEYFFEFVNLTEAASSGRSIYGGTGSAWQPTSKVWFLTKIITRNRSVITAEYVKSPLKNNQFPAYSENKQWVSPNPSLIQPVGGNVGGSYNYDVTGYYGIPSGTAFEQLNKKYSYTREYAVSLAAITFPQGNVTFSSSPRRDVVGGSKLDALRVYSVAAKQATCIHDFAFSYDYFDSSPIGGNAYTLAVAASPTDPKTAYFTSPNNTAQLRLKLLTVKDKTDPPHRFTYSSVPLPAKNSLAQDFWGYYNGQLSTTTLIPNPSRFRRPRLGNTNCNTSANAAFITAGSLTGIQFPTGGSAAYVYELNQFTNYWVPDFDSTNNVVSKGNGMRVKQVLSYDGLGQVA